MCSMYLWVLRLFFFWTLYLTFLFFYLCDGQRTSDDPQFVWDVRRDAGLESTLTRTCILFFCCFELDVWNSHSALGQPLDQAPAWEHSEAQYIQIFSSSLQNNEVTVITSIDISFGYQRRSRPSTSVPLPSCSSEWLSKIFNLIQVIVCSPTVLLLHWVSRWGYPAVHCHCTSSCHCPHRLPLFVFVSLSHFFWLPQSFCFAPGTATAFSILQPHTTLKPCHGAQLSISHLSPVSLCPCLLFLI